MAQNQINNPNQAPFSLINYQAQIEISDNIDEYQKAKHAAKKLDANPSPQDVLNNMITPRDWKTSEDKYYMQYVSHSKSSRDDVFTLKQSLEDELQRRQARKQGICSIRQQLFSQGFDEIIRQVTINCPERGLLLMRVRDEHKMSLAAYQTLYKSSTEYGMFKQLQSEQGMPELQQQVRLNQQNFDELNKKRIELESKKQSLQKKIFERQQIESQQMKDEIDMIISQATNLQAFLSLVRVQKQDKNKQNNIISNDGKNDD